MIDMTYGEMFLFGWAVASTAFAWQYRVLARDQQKMLQAAAAFTQKLVENDELRDEMRDIFSKAKRVEMKFGAGE